LKQLSIIPIDQRVVIDGVGLELEMTLASNIHAVQWDEVKKEGHVEYNDDTPTKTITNILDYKSLIKEFQVVQDRLIKEKKDALEANVTREATSDFKRFVAYTKEVPMGHQIDAIMKYIEAKGDADAELTNILSKRKDIKARFPKN